MVVDAVKIAGHSVVPWVPFKHDDSYRLVAEIYGSDRGEVISS